MPELPSSILTRLGMASEAVGDMGEKERDTERIRYIPIPARLAQTGEHLDLRHQSVARPIDQRIINDLDPDKVTYGVKLPAQCQNTYNQAGFPELEVVVKTFAKPLRGVFKHERNILLQLRRLNERRIMTQLVSYSYLEYSYILRPMAKCDLSHFWEMTDPENLPSSTRWMFNESVGLMAALSKMHHLSKPCGSSTHSKNLPVGIRHGDIKPRNILVMDDGTLVLNDFEMSAWTDEPEPSMAERTFEAPESELGRLLTASSDVWAMGCVVLEFLLWLLQGGCAIRKFDADRIMATPGYDESWKDDHFYTVQYENGKIAGAEVRETVKQYTDSMLVDERCIGPVREMLHLVLRSMIVVEPKTRMSFQDLVAELDVISKQFQVVS